MPQVGRLRRPSPNSTAGDNGGLEIQSWDRLFRFYDIDSEAIMRFAKQVRREFLIALPAIWALAPGFHKPPSRQPASRGSGCRTAPGRGPDVAHLLGRVPFFT